MCASQRQQWRGAVELRVAINKTVRVVVVVKAWNERSRQRLSSLDEAVNAQAANNCRFTARLPQPAGTPGRLHSRHSAP